MFWDFHIVIFWNYNDVDAAAADSNLLSIHRLTRFWFYFKRLHEINYVITASLDWTNRLVGSLWVFLLGLAQLDIGASQTYGIASALTSLIWLRVSISEGIGAPPTAGALIGEKLGVFTWLPHDGFSVSDDCLQLIFPWKHSKTCPLGFSVSVDCLQLLFCHDIVQYL